MAMKTLVLCMLFASTIADHPDYCPDKYNCLGEKHVGCDNKLWDGGFGSDCRDASFVQSSNEIQQAFLDTLNKRRNEVALNKVQHYDSAERMATITWDQDSADLAALTARVCKVEHDKCRNTEKFHQSGQSVGIQYEDAKANYQSDTHYATSAIDMWFDENKAGAHYKWMELIKKFNATDSAHEIGHFCTMVIDESHAVGCASTKYITKVDGQDWKAYLTVCNYARVPVIGSTIYKSGKTASACKTGPNTKYPGLCSEKEEYNDPK